MFSKTEFVGASVHAHGSGFRAACTAVALVAMVFGVTAPAAAATAPKNNRPQGRERPARPGGVDAHSRVKSGAGNKSDAAASSRRKYEMQVRVYQKAVRLNPDNERAWVRLGFYYGELGEFDKTVAAEKHAVRLNRNDARAWVDRGMGYDGDKQYLRAIPAERHALRLDPGKGPESPSWAAWENIGVAYAELGQYNKAVPAINHALQNWPEDADEWFRLGFTYVLLRRYDKAIAAEQRCLKLRPDDAPAWAVLGVLYCRRHDRSSAISVYHVLKKLSPGGANKLRQVCTEVDILGHKQSPARERMCIRSSVLACATAIATLATALIASEPLKTVAPC